MLLAAALLIIGVGTACGVSPRAGVVAAALITTIVLYDAVLKPRPLAPMLMGACRALNLLLGTCALDHPLSASVLLPAGLLWLYVASITLLARGEADRPSRWQVRAGIGGIVLAVAGLALLSLVVAHPHIPYLVLAGALLLAVAFVGTRAIRRPSSAIVQRSVGRFVLALIAFDACIAWAVAGTTAGLIVLALYIPAGMMARRFRMT